MTYVKPGPVPDAQQSQLVTSSFSEGKVSRCDKLALLRIELAT